MDQRPKGSGPPCESLRKSRDSLRCGRIHKFVSPLFQTGPAIMGHSLFVFVFLACACGVSGQSNSPRNERLADSLRTELFAQVDRCTAGMEWTKIASRRKGRRIKMVGKKQYMTIK